MSREISKETPLAEITLRKYENPKGSLNKRELSRKLCLSLGLLQPGDSRDVIVDVLQVLLEHTNDGNGITSNEVEELVEENREKYDLPVKGTAPSNIRRQILRLRENFLVEKEEGNRYRINEGETLSNIFAEKIEAYYLKSIVSRVKDYIDLADEEFWSDE